MATDSEILTGMVMQAERPDIDFELMERELATLRKYAAIARACEAGTHAIVPVEDLLTVARQAEDLKRECGMDPESPQAVRNGQYMCISYALRRIAAAPQFQEEGK
jgi:hypothetical protein